MKIKLLLILSLLFTCIVKGQQANPTGLPDIVQPSPTVATLMLMEQNPVDLYTGQPGISYPLVSHSASGISINLSVSYNTAALKIDSRSSVVGTGWSLTGMSSISRTVVDIPDEYNDNDNRYGRFHISNEWSYDNLYNNIDPLERGWKYNGDSNERFDTQSDVYQYNFFGNTGRFFVLKDINNELKVIMQDKSSNLKITPIYDNVTLAISSFDVTDMQGRLYSFDTVETTTTGTTVTSIPQGIGGEIDTRSFSSSSTYNVPTAYHLNEVQDISGNQILSIEYGDFSMEGFNGIKSNVTAEMLPIWNSYDYLFNAYNQTVLKPKRVTSWSQYGIRTYKPKVISFNDGVKINLTYLYNHPETGGYILNKVLKTDSGNVVISTTHLKTSSMNNRLWLDGIETGNLLSGSNLSFDFQYFDKDLPVFDSETDDFGYKSGYNIYPNQNNQQYFDLNRTYSGLLTKVVEPTGGKRKFEWGNHTFSYVGDQLYNNWYDNPLNSSDGFLNGYVNQNDTNNITNPTYIKSLPFNVPFDQIVRFSHNINEIVSNSFGQFRFEIFNSDLNETISTFGLDATNKEIQLTTGNYILKLFYFGSMLQSSSSNTSGTYQIEGPFKIQTRVPAALVNLNNIGGGFRINSIKLLDSDDSLQKTIDYDYSIPNTTYSSGSVDGDYRKQVQYHFFQHERGLYATAENNLHAGHFASPKNVQYYVKSDSPFNFLTKGSYVGYKYVSVSESGLGRTLNEFSNPIDFPAPLSTIHFPFATPFPNDLDMKRGNLLSKKVFKESLSSIPILEEHHVYEFESEEVLKNYIMGERFGARSILFSNYNAEISCVPNSNNPTNVGSNPSTAWPLNGTICNGEIFPVLFDRQFATFIHLKKMTEIQRNENSPEIINIVENQYNNSNYQNNFQKTTNSNGDVISSKTFYTIDSASLFANNIISTQTEVDLLAAMKAKNMVITPILQESYVNNVLTSRVKSVYSEFTPNQFLLKEVQTSKGNNPLEKRLEYKKYDIAGNIQEVMQADGTPITYLWGHNQTLPIAKIEGLSFSQVATKLNITPAALENYNESNLVAIDALRNLFSVEDPFMITTYTYEVGVGIETVRDPRGRVTTYHYDDFQRLEKVTDHEGNLVGKNEYKYATQN